MALEGLEKINFRLLDWRGKSHFKCTVCGKSYKMLGPHLDWHYQKHKDAGGTQKEVAQNTMAITEQGKINMGRALTEDEFNTIKEMQMRGEYLQDIVAKTGRSWTTVKRATQATHFDDYKVVVAKANHPKAEVEKRTYVKSGNYSAKPTQTEETVRPSGRYGRLREFRERLDDVLIDFILEEMEIKQKDLVDRIKQLEAENKRLQKRVEELEQPDFVKTLQMRLVEDERRSDDKGV